MKLMIYGRPDVIEIDDADLPIFSERRWWTVSNGNTKYLQGRVSGKREYFHRYLLRPDAAFVVDHIDGNGLNNRRDNLRIVSQQQNTWNRREYKGSISFRDNHWHAMILINGKKVHLGFFKDETTARKAKEYAHKILRGTFARDNGLDLSGFDPLWLTPTARKALSAIER
jgi:hypothetical protein